MLNYVELATHIHGMAVSKGWWQEGKRPAKELLMLMLTEVAEATEEVRNGNPPMYWETPTGRVTQDDLGGSFTLLVGDKLQKGEGEAVEIADVAIRIFDTLGHLNVPFDQFIKNYKDAYGDIMWKGTLEAHFDVAEALTAFARLGGDETTRLLVVCSKCLCLIERYFQVKGWDLEKTIAAKVAYNATRPERHGGKKH